MQEGKEERKGRRERRKKSNEREEGRKEGKGGSGARKDQSAAAGWPGLRSVRPPALSAALQDGGGEGLLPLTGPEQHGPVQPGGLGGHPRPLAQPLRHAPARRTAEPALRAGSAEQRGRRLCGPNPPRVRLPALRPWGAEAPRGRARSQGEGRSTPPGSRQDAGKRLVSGPLGLRSQVQGENRVP